MGRDHSEGSFTGQVKRQKTSTAGEGEKRERKESEGPEIRKCIRSMLRRLRLPEE